MSEIEVTTQAQLDEALANQKPRDVIVCLGGTWDNPLVAWGSSSVVACGSASVEAWGSASVVAWDSSRVEAWDSASVVAWGSASVVAWDSSRVEAWDSASVVAWDSSRVEAWGSASVVAWDSSRVEASKYVPVQKMPGHAGKISGGVVIDVPDVSRLDAAGWCDYYGVQVVRGAATLFKAVGDDLSTSRARAAGIVYTPGSRVAAPDWDSTPECGHGLHASPSPAMAESYNRAATRYVQVRARLSDLVVIGDKIKCRRLTVVAEVDRFGDPVRVAEAAA